MSTMSHKIISINQALQQIATGNHIVTAMAASEPRLFFGHLHDYIKDPIELTIHCANPTQEYPCFLSGNHTGNVNFHVMFLTPAVRNHQGQGSVQYVPQHLSQWTRNLFTRCDPDIFWGTCSMPDQRGFVSLGTGCCYESEVLRRAKKVILEMNPHVPVTYGATHVPVSAVDYFIEHEAALPTVQGSIIDDTDRKIGLVIADLIEDGSTIQLGIGSIPNALAEALTTKKDLGIHTEMINDTMMTLALNGVVTGKFKTIWPGKIVGAFAYGSKELYDFLHQNPMFELQPASVVNDPVRIGRNHKMISINTALEIDLTGQVCSESLGHRELSGVGGATDTHVGAQKSAGGRGIIALHATTKSGESKIVFELHPGAKVSISRNDVDTIVTEFGIASLRGKTVDERVEAMIAIAHPKFRPTLQEQAQSVGYLCGQR